MVLIFIAKDSSPRPNGFGSEFYKTCWNFVKENLLEAVKEFFSKVSLLRFFTSSYFFLIPKIKYHTIFDKFMPISLCSITYKIFPKIIVGRLTSCLNRIIFLEQWAFLLDRNIFKNITFAQKMVYLISKKSKGGNKILKVDMAKTYDWIDWCFLLWVMEGFSFSNKVCNLIS